MASTLNSKSKANSMQRVKVYCLDKDGKWDDRGTGLVSMDYMEVSQELGLYVIDEDDNATLLVHRISIEDIYKKQEGTDTIISWRDAERSTELALSFQETAGCCYIWDQISNMQRSINFNSLTSETFYNVNNELKELPDVNPSTLSQILKIVTEGGITDLMRLSELMLKDDLAFFQNLMKVFEICEKSKDIDGLHMIFNIVKGIISLNSSEILEKILGEKLITKVIGCLEYDPSVPQPQHHRKYLEEHVVFKEAIPIKDPLVLSKVHQTYRMCYLKDVVLTRVLDGVTAGYIDSAITENKATVVTSLKDDSTFLKELFARLRSPSTSAEAKKNLVHFLHEFCSLSNSNLQPQDQTQLFRELVSDGIFEIIADVLQNPDKKLVLTGTDILYIFLTHDPNLLRSYVAKPENPLLGHLVKRTMEDFGDEMECQFIEVIRLLLNSSALPLIKRVNIMDIFCEKHLPEIVDFVTASCPGKPSSNTSEGAQRSVGSHCGTKPKVLLNICELLCLCLQQDSFKTNFLDKNMTEKVLLLTRRKEKAVVAAAIRVFRTLLSVLDDNLQSYIVKNNLMKPIIDVLVAPGNRNNLVSSAVLELLEYIRKLNATVLLKYIVDTFWDKLTPFKHLSSIQAFKTNYEQCLVSDMMRENEGDVDNHGKENRDEEQSNTQTEEAKPFHSNGEAIHSTSQSLSSGDLVDHEEDRKLPHEKQSKASISEEERQKNKTSPCKENDKEQTKRQRLCSIIEGNKNSQEQGDDESSALTTEMDVDGS